MPHCPLVVKGVLQNTFWLIDMKYLYLLLILFKSIRNEYSHVQHKVNPPANTIHCNLNQYVLNINSLTTDKWMPFFS